MVLYFVRHGETQWNTLGKLQGEKDIPLNDQGKMLAEITGKALENVRFDKVIISPYIRAKQTAQLIAGKDTPMESDRRIREITWGQWDGLTAEQIKERGKKYIYDLFYTDPFAFPGAPGGETIRQVCERGKSFFEDISGREDLADCNVLVVTHGCAVRGILNHLYENPDDFWQGGVPANCSVNILEIKNGKTRFIEKDRIYYDPELSQNHYVLE